MELNKIFDDVADVLAAAVNRGTLAVHRAQKILHQTILALNEEGWVIHSYSIWRFAGVPWITDVFAELGYAVQIPMPPYKDLAFVYDMATGVVNVQTLEGFIVHTCTWQELRNFAEQANELIELFEPKPLAAQG